MNRKHNDNLSSTLAEKGSLQDKDEECIKVQACNDHPKVLFIEPFYGGSHKQLMDLLVERIPENTLVTLSAKKWHWRARCSSLILSKTIPKITTETTLFCSSVLNLCELVGLRPDLHALKKIVYFHENQLIYPIRQIKDRDVQYAYNQILTCLVADDVVFNSTFNKESFLNNISKVLKLLPDNRPKNIKEDIAKKATVLYFPLKLDFSKNNLRDNGVLRIVWPHRWEYDKGPDKFIKILWKLKENKYNFRVSFLGQCYKDIPDIITNSKQILKDEILAFGYVESRNDYLNILSESHVAVSTAKHEFFGVSMLEAVSCGCFPMVPNALVYPEIYPSTCLYDNDDDLYAKLAHFCEFPETSLTMRAEMNINLHQYSADYLLPKYLEILNCR